MSKAWLKYFLIDRLNYLQTSQKWVLFLQGVFANIEQILNTVLRSLCANSIVFENELLVDSSIISYVKKLECFLQLA